MTGLIWSVSSVTAGVLLFIMVVIVGHKSSDRDWMPRADLIWLSWAYAFAVVSLFLALGSAYYFGLESKINWNAQPPEPKLFGLPYRQADAGLDPPTDQESVFQ